MVLGGSGRGVEPKRGRGRPRKYGVLENREIKIGSNAEAQGEMGVGPRQEKDNVVLTNRGREVKQPLRFVNPPDQPGNRKRKRKRFVSSGGQANARLARHRKNLVQGNSISKIMGFSARSSFQTLTNRVIAAAKGLNPSQDFDVGDIVWVTFLRKRTPAWPGEIVEINEDDAPPSLLSHYIPGGLCVMLFGPAFRGDGKWDLVWARPEMLFPFLDCLEKFQDEFLRLSHERSSADFRKAVEEATFREFGHGFGDGLDLCLPVATTARNNSADDEMVRRESILYLYKQFCDICRRVCSDDELNRGRWLRCHKCDVWCHAGCDSDSSKYPKAEYMCPKCRLYFEFAQKKKKEATKKGEDRVGVENDQAAPCAPYRVTVLCNDREADYLPNYHLVLCKCSKCESGVIMGIGDWELHAGSKMKRWKQSVKVKGINISLIGWLSELHEAGVSGLAYLNPELGEAPPNSKERDLIINLLAPYQPYKAAWSLGTCAACLSNQDEEQNRIIVCDICQIAVHQECYGARNVEGEAFDSWVCRACETPNIKRECCLCPVVGGALKPTTTRQFWVHVTCAWLVKEVVFPDEEAMEPADGVLRVDKNSFKKICVICNQIHGSCIQCYRCPTSFHAMCAASAGYWIQLSIYGKDKSGRDVGKWISYCAKHKLPKSHHPPGLILDMPSTHQKLKDQQDTASIPTHTSVQEGGETQGEEELTTASRCRAWPYRYKKETEAIFHQPRGYCHHPPEVIEAINCFNQRTEFPSLKERFRHALENERKLVGVGKSRIHGQGLFARKPILQGEMVIEYRGEIIGKAVADIREELYREQGIDCYFFKITEDKIIDATKKGNIGRHINHSCEPNIFAKIIDGKGRIELIAAKDIAAREELYFDYRFQEDADEEVDKVPCNCGAPTCRKYMT